MGQRGKQWKISPASTVVEATFQLDRGSPATPDPAARRQGPWFQAAPELQEASCGAQCRDQQAVARYGKAGLCVLLGHPGRHVNNAPGRMWARPSELHCPPPPGTSLAATSSSLAKSTRNPATTCTSQTRLWRHAQVLALARQSPPYSVTHSTARAGIMMSSTNEEDPFLQVQQCVAVSPRPSARK
jgi:hypothetical protein